ncbi:MAG: hypothetical protein J7J75_01310 [Euryarchaeota archaeon]|nr:hypothetical protein [Euryarchaeota archaeon]MCD6158263.1 hypothetical protein [Euryarchaeota archaeon]
MELKERGQNIIVPSHVFSPLKDVFDAIFALDAGRLIDIKEYLMWSII